MFRSGSRAVSGELMAGAAEGAHRLDVDGLRAFAVLSVLLYHGNSSWLPGGFVGVDVFFVISGYLISGIILKGLADGRFSFAAFYARRIRRIFPALACMLLVVFGFGWFSMFSDEYQMLGKHVAAGAAFVSNIVLWKEAGYFDPAGALKPLLHLWSLGIEEQFYLLWPLLLAIVWRCGISPLRVIAAVFIASFALNAYWIADHEIRVFYLPVTRFWELAAGALLAAAQLQWKLRGADSSGAGAAQWTDRGRAVLSCAGLALLVASVTLISREMQFPGWWALLPVAGAVSLIAAGERTWINRHVFGNRPMVFVGLISYPLYLWHWPLLSVQRILGDGPLSTPVVLATLLLAGLLAWATYRWVETPIRTDRRLLATALPLAGAVAFLGVIGLLGFFREIAPRSSFHGVDPLVLAGKQMAFPGPDLRRDSDEPNPVWEQGTQAQAVLFIGDSEIEQYYPRIDWLLRNHPDARKIVYSSKGGCPPVPHVREPHLPGCDGLVERDRRLALRPDIDTIVVAADWSGYFLDRGRPETFFYSYDDGNVRGLLRGALGKPAGERALRGFQSMIREFVQAGKEVYLVLPSPTGAQFAPRNLVERDLMDWSFKVRTPAVSTAQLTAEIRPIVERLRAIAAATGARTIDPVASLCNQQVCPLLDSQGRPVYKDESHLSPQFVRDNVRYLDQLVLRGPLQVSMRDPRNHS